MKGLEVILAGVLNFQAAGLRGTRVSTRRETMASPDGRNREVGSTSCGHAASEMQDARGQQARFLAKRPEELVRTPLEMEHPSAQGSKLPLLVDENGIRVSPRAASITTPGVYAAAPSDETSYGVRRAIAQPNLFHINEFAEQVEPYYPSDKRARQGSSFIPRQRSGESNLPMLCLGNSWPKYIGMDSDDLHISGRYCKGQLFRAALSKRGASDSLEKMLEQVGTHCGK